MSLALSRPSGRGIGIACGTDAGTWVAEIAKVKVDKATGKVIVERVVVAQDMDRFDHSKYKPLILLIIRVWNKICASQVNDHRQRRWLWVDAPGRRAWTVRS